MQPEILTYIQSQRVGVLAIEMLDGSPHAATVHYAHGEDTHVFYFETSNKYRKSEALLGRSVNRASLVIGASETEMKTLQLDGEVRVITAEEKSAFDDIYFKKFPEKKAKAENNPDIISFVFSPLWWRFTDWTAPEGKKIITSQ